MTGNTDGQRLQPGARQFRNWTIFYARQHKGEGARPETRRQPFRKRAEGGIAARDLKGRYMDDQRVEAWSAFRLIDGGNRLVVQRIAAKAIDRLGREGDEPARLNLHRRRVISGRAGFEYLHLWSICCCP
ncbi:hypothetical protein [uncultured Sneathiella sp.]|uniref:hypothetical protein n=1 Tax=uncultured Sneathiella sp. TaxID=879315 RepID=UPI0030DDA4D0